MELIGTSAFPPPQRRLRLGFVGGGQGAFIGAVHASGARLSNRWEVIAGALSSNLQRALASGKEWFLNEDRIYSDYEDMARKEAARSDGIDAVVIVTPNHMHYPVAKAFMLAGMDVICDKPVTATLEQALDLLKIRDETGVFFGVTYSYSAHSMVRQARAMIKAGMLGDIRQIHVEYFQEWAVDLPDDGSAWRLDPEKSGGCFSVGDIGTHAFHLAEFVADRKVDSLLASFHVCGQPKALEDTAFMHLKFAGNIPGTLMISQAAAGNQCDLGIRIFGTEAGLEWRQENPEYIRFTPVDKPTQILWRGFGAGILDEARRLVRLPRGHPEALTDAWANLYTEFSVAIEARRSGQKLEDGLLADCPQLDDGVRGLKFVDAAIASNRTRQWIQIPG